MKPYTQKQKYYFGKIAEEYAIKKLSEHGKVRDFRGNKQPFDLTFNKKIIEIKSSQLLHTHHWVVEGIGKTKRSRLGYFYVNKDQHDFLKEKHNAYYIFILMINKEVVDARIIKSKKVNDIIPRRQFKKHRKYPNYYIPLSVLYESQKLNGGLV